MDPAISQAIATFIGACTTAVLLAAAYYWGPNRREAKSIEKKHRRQLESEALEDE